MNILVVEDDINQRDTLVKIIEKEFLDLRVYKASTVNEALQIINSKPISLFLLDINLNKESGIDLAQKIRSINEHKLTGIVFITTEMIHIIDAFKNIHCYDFIVKPYKVDDIKKIINTFIKGLKTQNIKEGKHSYIEVDNNLSIKIYHNDIFFIEYINRNCILHTTNGEYVIKSTTLKKIMQQVVNDDIIQSHKSFIVNVNHIEKVEKIYTKLWDIHFRNYNKTAQLGFKYRDIIVERLDK